MDSLVNREVQYDQDGIVSLEKWLNRLLLIAKETHKNAKHNQTKSFFLIATTGKQDAKSLPYTTPLRQTEYGWLFGTIVFSQSQAVLAASMLDGKVDYIFVDAEKKLEMSLNNDSNVLEYFGIFSNLLTKNIKHIEYGNISAACTHVVKKSTYHEY